MLFDSALISSGYEMEGSAEDFAQRMQRILRSGMFLMWDGLGCVRSVTPQICCLLTHEGLFIGKKIL